MSFSQYIWVVAHSLRRDILPHLEDENLAKVLAQSIQVLTATANALEVSDCGVQVAPSSSLSDENIALLSGPPESPGVNISTAQAIRQSAEAIDAGAPIERGDVRDALRFEKNAIDSAIDRMNEIETAPPAVVTLDDQIEPKQLECYLRDATGDSNLRLLNFTPVLGGRSRQTVLFSIDETDALPRDLVIQRLMPGMGGASAFIRPDQEYELLAILRDSGMLVPRPLLLQLDKDALGAPFLVLERMRGKVVQADYWSPPASGRIALQLAEQMAKLHSRPVASFSSIFGDVRAVTASDRRAEIETFASWWYGNAHWPSTTMSAAISWLRERAPSVRNISALVHNDMVFHNILADDNGISAILDWEQTSFGHPGEDLGYAYPTVSQATDWNRFLEVYAHAGGPELSKSELDFFIVRAQVRLMGLVLITGRHVFEASQNNQVILANAGAHFVQRLMHRVAAVLDDVLSHA